MAMAITRFISWKRFSTSVAKTYYNVDLSKRWFSSINNIASRDDILPVLIVGAGPVGLILSLLLTKLGVKCTVIEKNDTFSLHPQAHFINNRSMELFRKMDGLAKEIQSLQPPVNQWRKFIYCTSLSGSILGSIDHIQTQDFQQIISPISVAHFSQYKLTRLLLNRLKNLNFHVRSSSGLEGLNHEDKAILMGHECISIEPTSHGSIVGVSFLKNGKMMKRNIHCKVLVGADGAGSTVRRLIGINMKGERDLHKLISIHFFSRDLGQYLLQERPAMLFFIFNPESIGVLVAHDLNKGEFILQIPFYPPQQSLKDFNSKVCEEIILKLVGKSLEDVNIIDVKQWVMNAEVADKFIYNDNRVILVGDAAHRFPPAGGFGMNTGIQDAHNLAWKIALADNGIASSSILQTYEMERKQIAISNTALSMQNFKAAMSIPSALGLDPSVANSVHGVLNSAVGSILPSGLQKVVLEGVFTIGRLQLSEFLLDGNNPLGNWRLKKLRNIFDEGKSLQLQFPAEDLGFRYSLGALIPEDDEVKQTSEVSTGRRRDYIPSSKPGSRLPHMNLRLVQNLQLQNEEIISSLDLISGERVEFLLIIAPIEASYKLAHAALKVAKGYNILLKVCVVWPHHSFEKYSHGNKNKLEHVECYIDVEEIKNSSSSWWDLCQITNKGAILVRPDEHVAWRTKSELVDDPILLMDRVFSQILGFAETNINHREK